MGGKMINSHPSHSDLSRDSATAVDRFGDVLENSFGNAKVDGK